MVRGRSERWVLSGCQVTVTPRFAHLRCGPVRTPWRRTRGPGGSCGWVSARAEGSGWGHSSLRGHSPSWGHSSLRGHRSLLLLQEPVHAQGAVCYGVAKTIKARRYLRVDGVQDPLKLLSP